MNAYEQTKNLIKEITTLDRTMRVHESERFATITRFGKETYDLQTQHIALRRERAEAELAFIRSECFFDYARARRDLLFPPIEVKPPVRFFAENAVRRRRIGQRIVEFFRLQEAA